MAPATSCRPNPRSPRASGSTATPCAAPSPTCPSAASCVRAGAPGSLSRRPADYPIGRRVRFHQNVRATGRLPQKQVLRVEVRPGDVTECKALGLKPGTPVVVYEGLSLANATPIAHFQSIFPEPRLPGLPATLAETPSVTGGIRPDLVRRRPRHPDGEQRGQLIAPAAQASGGDICDPKKRAPSAASFLYKYSRGRPTPARRRGVRRIFRGRLRPRGCGNRRGWRGSHRGSSPTRRGPSGVRRSRAAGAGA